MRGMPALDALKDLLYGYSSGNVLARVPGPHRILEQLRVGASYRQVFLKAIAPYIRSDSRVLELGPGRGSWTRAILEHVPDGEVHVVDFQDVRKWIKPEAGSGRLVCYRVSDNSFAAVPDDFFDFFWSFGVLCHNNLEHIREVLRNSLGKLKPGAIAIHQIADWNKLNELNWSWRTVYRRVSGRCRTTRSGGRAMTRRRCARPQEKRDGRSSHPI